MAFGLVLATRRGTRNGVAFILGWITTVTLIGVVTALLGGSISITNSNTPGAWTLALEIVMGALLIVVWMRRRFRPKPKPEHEVVEVKPQPAWQRKIDSMGYVGAFILGGAVQTWPVMIAAAAEVVRTDLSGWETFLLMVGFAVATTAGIVTLEILAIRTPGSAAARLDRMQGLHRPSPRLGHQLGVPDRRVVVGRPWRDRAHLPLTDVVRSWRAGAALGSDRV